MVDIKVVCGSDRECTDFIRAYGEFYLLTVQSTRESEFVLVDIDLTIACIGIHKSVFLTAAKSCL